MKMKTKRKKKKKMKKKEKEYILDKENNYNNYIKKDYD